MTNITSKKITNLTLLLLILLAGFFRLFQLSSLPISLFGDEVDVGYQAWSLISTGRDYMGHFLPTYIQSLSEWRAPLLMYLTAPFVGVLGPTTLAVRLPISLSGIISIYFVYLVSKKLFNSSRIGLISAALLAITPWHIHYSRASFEVVPLVLLYLIGVYLFLSDHLQLSLLSFVLTFYLYSTATFFTPLLLFALVFVYRPPITKKHLTTFILPLLFLLPAIYNIFWGPSAGRFRLISIFNDQKTIDQLVIQRTDPWVDKSSTESLFHNKPLAFATSFATNYVRSLSPEFLFLSGDPNFRHSIGDHGELLWVTAPFLFYGLFLLFTNIKSKSSLLLLIWLFASPLASSLTQDGGNHATRLFIMLPPLIIISAWGISTALEKLPYTAFSSLIMIGFSVAIISYWHRYSYHYRFESARYWHDGYSQIFGQLKATLNSNSKIYINNTSEPSLIRFAFYTSLPPADFQKMFQGDQSKPMFSGQFIGFQFGSRFYFGQSSNLDTIDNLLAPGDIYLAAQGKEIPGDWNLSINPPSRFSVVGYRQDIFGHPQFYLLRKNL